MNTGVFSVGAARPRVLRYGKGFWQRCEEQKGRVISPVPEVSWSPRVWVLRPWSAELREDGQALQRSIICSSVLKGSMLAHSETCHSASDKSLCKGCRMIITNGIEPDL